VPDVQLAWLYPFDAICAMGEHPDVGLRFAPSMHLQLLAQRRKFDAQKAHFFEQRREKCRSHSVLRSHAIAMSVGKHLGTDRSLPSTEQP